MVKYDFSGKTVAITGGGSGIGKLSCQRFAEAGAKVAVIDINGEAAQQTADELTAMGFEVAADVNEALWMAIAEKGHDAHIAVIPDGVSVMVH